MAKLSADDSAKLDTKQIDTTWGGTVTVPASTVVGENLGVKSSTMKIGENCTFGDNVRLHAFEVGTQVTICSSCSIDDDCRIGDRVVIGPDSWLGRRSQIGDDVNIGQHVSIGNNVRVQPGVVVPDNWVIPDDAVVNPGPDGFPIVIMPAPSFRCNINGQLSTGGRGW